MNKTKKIQTLLIANRGEIACRIIRTAKKLHIKTVAVYSEIDAHALHVALADEAVLIGPTPSNQSYLNIDAILKAAADTHADAIHPGYGFLSENAEFAERCQQAHLIFIGPNAAVIRLMGDKQQAKLCMSKAGIPTTPGSSQHINSDAELQQQAEKIGFPLLIKAVAGGGGKGMRLVNKREELSDAIQSAQREAKSSFGSDRIFFEKYLPKARHVEVQIIGDNSGQVLHLFTRDCSIQRRHQKIIEEAPAPNLSAELRQKLHDAAVMGAKSVHYTNAGTMEFLVDGEQFYFMEMNTRLQVEHPVTEMITGVDLVEWQLLVATGESLPRSQQEIIAHGHAIEARICAENPQKDFKPSSGVLAVLQFPHETKHLRIETGVRAQDQISIYYDSMIAKMIVHDHDREHAIKNLRQALMHTYIVGVDSNLELLSAITREHDFAKADLDTGFLKKHPELIQTTSHIPDMIFAAAIIFYHELLMTETHQLTAQSNDAQSPWLLRDHWRLLEPRQWQLSLWSDHHEFKVTRSVRDDLTIIYTEQQKIEITSWEIHDHQIKLQLPNDHYRYEVFFIDAMIHVFDHGHHYHFNTRNPKLRESTSYGGETRLIAPMPGTLIALAIKPQQHVKKGDKLAVLEAMKMEHAVLAPSDGVIKSVHFKVGDLVAEGAELAEFE